MPRDTSLSDSYTFDRRFFFQTGGEVKNVVFKFGWINSSPEKKIYFLESFFFKQCPFFRPKKKEPRVLWLSDTWRVKVRLHCDFLVHDSWLWLTNSNRLLVDWVSRRIGNRNFQVAVMGQSRLKISQHKCTFKISWFIINSGQRSYFMDCFLRLNWFVFTDLETEICVSCCTQIAERNFVTNLASQKNRTNLKMRVSHYKRKYFFS